MERQEKEIKKIQRLLSDAESMWKDLPRLADLHRSTNQTMESINKSTESLLINNEMGMYCVYLLLNIKIRASFIAHTFSITVPCLIFLITGHLLNIFRIFLFNYHLLAVFKIRSAILVSWKLLLRCLTRSYLVPTKFLKL